MLRIRRLYFYLVLYVSLNMLLVGLATLLRVLLERAFAVPSSGLFGLFIGADQIREHTALGIALTVVGLPVWLLHWRVVQGWLHGEAGAADRASDLRRLYLYGVLLTTGLATYFAGRDVLELALKLVLGLPGGQWWLSGVTGTFPFVLTAALFWAYHWRVTAEDRGLVGEEGDSATLRRLYLYGLLALGVLSLMINVTTLGQRSWEVALNPMGREATFAEVALARTVASSGATVLLSLVVWLGHEAWSQSMLAVPLWQGEDERRSVLRKVYLYGLVLVTVAWALVQGSEILRFLVASALGVAPSAAGGTPVLAALGGPLMNALVFGVFWAYYWRAVSREAAVQVEVGGQSGVRRVYFYLVSAIALAFVGWSMASLLRLGADLVLQPAVMDPSAVRGELARSVSWAAIGLPVWLFHWSRSQQLTAGPRGVEETRSTTRRWYLYVVAFAGVAVLLLSGAQVVYSVVLRSLGREVEIGQISDAVMNAAVGAVVLWYHWFLVLRADLAALREVAGARQAVAVVAGLDAEGAARLEQFVRASLSDARTRLYWTDQAHAQDSLTQVLDASEHADER